MPVLAFTIRIAYPYCTSIIAMAYGYTFKKLYMYYVGLCRVVLRKQWRGYGRWSDKKSTASCRGLAKKGPQATLPAPSTSPTDTLLAYWLRWCTLALPSHTGRDVVPPQNLQFFAKSDWSFLPNFGGPVLGLTTFVKMLHIFKYFS